MSEKQDRTGVRTAVDLERKYNFGKTFAEMLGLINDSRDKVDSVESSLRNEIKDQATTLMRDTEKIVMTATESVKTELNGDIEDVSKKVASLELNADQFRVSVEQELSDMSSRVDMTVDADDVSIIINERLADGVDSVTTSTGYRFDSDGLNISKSGNAMENRIDNTGMYVTRRGVEILTANKDGVNATNLHAKTYLIVGSGEGRSRFEDYESDRTGCFWIG